MCSRQLESPSLVDAVSDTQVPHGRWIAVIRVERAPESPVVGVPGAVMGTGYLVRRGDGVRGGQYLCRAVCDGADAGALFRPLRCCPGGLHGRGAVADKRPQVGECFGVTVCCSRQESLVFLKVLHAP